MNHPFVYRLAVSVLAGLTASLALAAGVPAQITYQGQLGKSGGAAPPKGIYLIHARIWDNATGGNVMWGKAYPVNVDTNGSFNVNLGDGGGATTPVPAYDALPAALDGGARFLGITVVQTPAGAVTAPKEISPRMQWVSSPYALHAGMADYAMTWNGRSASQLASVPASGTPVGASAVLGYDGTNVNCMAATFVSNHLGGTVNGPVTIARGVLQSQDQVRLNANGISPLSTNGIALAGNVGLMGSSAGRNWGWTYTESTDGFLIVPWSLGPGGPGGSLYSKIWVTANFASGQDTIVLYSAAVNAPAGAGFTLLPMPAGLTYRVDCGVRQAGPPGPIFFQALGR